MERDEYFLRLAKTCSLKSKDPSTKTGAVIVDEQSRIVSTGYNGFPQKMQDNKDLYENREEKYSRIIHCEMNALIFAHRNLDGCTLYTWPFLSCDRCAVHLVQAGITRFVAPICPSEALERWSASFDKTRRYLCECNVQCHELAIDLT